MPVESSAGALAGWLGLLERHAVHQQVVGLTLSRGSHGRQPIDVPLKISKNTLR